MNKKDDVEIIKLETAFQGYFRVDEYHLRHRLFSGQWGNVVQREIFERGSAVAVLPYDPVRDEVILIEQFRPGTLNQTDNPWLFEIVAGIIETGEKVEQVAERECKEEAGVDILDLKPMGRMWMSPGGCSEHVHFFCAKVDATQSGGVFGLADENEDIMTHVMPARQAFEKLKKDEFRAAPAVIALQWLALHHDDLKQW